MTKRKKLTHVEVCNMVAKEMKRQRTRMWFVTLNGKPLDYFDHQESKRQAWRYLKATMELTRKQILKEGYNVEQFELVPVIVTEKSK